jgi:predicted nucleic-acid-binding protein
MDIFLKRQPFFEDSYQALKKSTENGAECYISSTAATDIYYILNKNLKSSDTAKTYISNLLQFATFTDVLSADIIDALSSKMTDFEDAVVDAVAKRIGASYILTRNIKDFLYSKTHAITPTEFLKQ